MSTKQELKRIAWAEAAAWLQADCDRGDLPADLSEADEEYVREFIRIHIVSHLAKKAEAV
jgi:hypothetical protein